MTDHTARPGRDGQFYVHDPGGRQVAGPYQTLEAAERHARALTRNRWLLVVEQSERSASPWDAYVTFFRHIGGGRSAAERLLDWWLALSDGAYAHPRARARGRRHRPLAPEPADPALAVSFAPDAIREHFDGTDRRQQALRLPDGTLEAAVRDVVFTSDRLRALFDELCLDVLDRAAAEAAGGQR